MQDWQFWGIISLLFVINSNVTDNPISSIMSLAMAVFCVLIALIKKNPADKF